MAGGVTVDYIWKHKYFGRLSGADFVVKKMFSAKVMSSMVVV